MNINLNDHVNKQITVRLRNGKVKTDTVKQKYIFTYSFDGIDYDSNGEVFNSHTFHNEDIVEIIQPKNKMKGLAQRRPNINFDQFLGKKVAVKYDNEMIMIGIVTKSKTSNIFYLNGHYILGLNDPGWIAEEIYDENAFTLTLQEIPVDESVEKVVNLAKGMTTEQIAEVISRLKGDSK